MIGTFFWAMAAGHIYIVALVSAVQVITFKEVIAIANVPSREKKLQFTKSLNWYFLAATMYFLYGESVIYYFKHIVLVDALLLPLATHHRFISFILYMMGMTARAPLDPPAYLLMGSFRLCILRRLPQEGTLQVSIHTIRLDAHGPLSCRCSVALHHEQRLRGNDLVLPSSIPCCHERHFRLYLWNNFWPNPAHQNFSQEDGRRIFGRLGLHCYSWAIHD